MIEFKKWYFRIYLFFVRILIVSMIIGISFPVHVFGTTFDHAGQNWKINVSSNERQVVPDELKQLYCPVYRLNGCRQWAYFIFQKWTGRTGNGKYNKDYDLYSCIRERHN